MSASMHCAGKEEVKDDICMIELLFVFQFSLYVQEAYFRKQKKTIPNNHLSLERSILIRVFFIKNTQRKINSGSPLQAALEWINCKHHCSLDSESQATKKLYVDDKRMEIEARPWNAFDPYLFK